MPPHFCPKCGSVMRLHEERGRIVAICPVCGYKEILNRKARPVSLKPVEVDEETSVKRGIVKDKEAKRIVIDEDTVKDALDRLEGSFEE